MTSVRAISVLVLALMRHPGAAATPPLRVCADPNNLPFSNSRGEGFENRIAALLAADLRTRIEYVWWPQRRGFLRHTLDAGRCDVVIGMPARMEAVLTTKPYYRSTYVFVSPRGRYRGLTLEDPRLGALRIGVQVIGGDFASSPPAQALAARGITQNIIGYSVLSDYSQANPPARIVKAVLHGDIDTALVWGPLAGYFAGRAGSALEITPVPPAVQGPFPFAFDIAMAVRRGDTERRRLLDDFLTRHTRAIDVLLAEFGVPRLDRTARRGTS